MVEGGDAQQAIAEAARRTTSRRDLSRDPHFEEISPEVGTLDEEAFDDLLAADPDAALSLLPKLTSATDERLRELARRLAGRVLVDLARGGAAHRRGVGRLRRTRGTSVGDLDLDASLDAVVTARITGTPPMLDEMTFSAWHRPSTAICLLVDRSGSMAGARLAATAIAAASVIYRHPSDCSVVAFSDEAIVVASQGEVAAADRVVGDLLRLRGHGTTDVALALRVAHRQLDRSTAGRKVALLLSDCRATAGSAAATDAAALDELAIICPADDRLDAERLAAATGARCVALDAPTDAPAAIAMALG